MYKYCGIYVFVDEKTPGTEKSGCRRRGNLKNWPKGQTGLGEPSANIILYIRMYKLSCRIL